MLGFRERFMLGFRERFKLDFRERFKLGLRASGSSSPSTTEPHRAEHAWRLPAGSD
jgi:hypothetical protein